ncbi:MAG: bifunctional glutamate N-acetyltransferase/amino-acid acetyltransferase ArgJ [Deltaproteobacteria bacterium]|nr:bifunctional glutamate N-acetyltransferase/amino-acid acetyltransferase ArgJ [Deltaproteobacteria bacterium]
MSKFCPGFLTAGINAGLKEDGKKDLGLIYSQTPASVAGVFTKNIIKAAPVIIDIEKIKKGYAQAVIINSKNANCCTGKKGIEDAYEVINSLALQLQIDRSLVFISSTGIIGQPFPKEKIKFAIPKLIANSNDSKGKELAEAIMTTDTVFKLASVSKKINGISFTVSGVAKGAGMIHPDMATMLCFVCTDIKADQDKLQTILNDAIANSFHKITIDGDTSTNDTVLLLANGASGLSIDKNEVKKAFEKSLNEILLTLAKKIVKDGEGATKLVQIKVIGALTRDDAKKIADVIASSPLVKTAIFGEDANWGRILAAAGRAGVNFNPNRINLFFDEVMIMENSRPCGEKAEKKASAIIKKDEFVILLDINMGGEASATVYTCDLSVDYVKINADYRT